MCISCACCSSVITLRFVWLFTCSRKHRSEQQGRPTWKYLMAIVDSMCHFLELAAVLRCLYLPATTPGFVKSFPVFDN